MNAIQGREQELDILTVMYSAKFWRVTVAKQQISSPNLREWPVVALNEPIQYIIESLISFLKYITRLD